MITEKKLKSTLVDPSGVPNTHTRFQLNSIQKVSLFYLFLVPFLTLMLGFGIGHVHWQWYLPGWLANTLLMLAALQILLKQRPSGDPFITVASLLLIVPWIIFPIFAGMGRPPQTVRGWLELVGEQHVRYSLLISGGIIAYLGTALLYQFLRSKEKVFTTLGISLMTLALPLFLINMAYWGSFLSEAFNHFKTAARPDWYQPFQELLLLIDTIQVSLIYLASAMFALALGRTGHFRPVAVRIYVAVSLIAALLNLIPPSAPVPFSVISYLVSVPAIPLVMFYLMGINLLRTDPAD
ncbi:hypothetical protein [Mucilaginibacter sp.]|uniref:hypothetical protein n=1 Tax=Mucilaginibacter sp. TaxID=1882438 RepID=UPI0032674C6F